MIKIWEKAFLRLSGHVTHSHPYAIQPEPATYCTIWLCSCSQNETNIAYFRLFGRKRWHTDAFIHCWWIIYMVAENVCPISFDLCSICVSVTKRLHVVCTWYLWNTNGPQEEKTVCIVSVISGTIREMTHNYQTCDSAPKHFRPFSTFSPVIQTSKWLEHHLMNIR